MYSSVQCVFLLDVNSIYNKNSENSNTNNDLSKITLCVLRLLTEFGAQTEKGNECVRWSFKFYDSQIFKPGGARKIFSEFSKCLIDDFEKELYDKINNLNESRKFNKGKSDQSVGNKNPSFILKKALQEVLIDYNWDSPDISSPVKTKHNKLKNTKHRLLPNSNGLYNAVVLLTNVPKSYDELEAFIGQKPATDFVTNILDDITFKGFIEKKLRLYFIDNDKKNNVLDWDFIVKTHSSLLKLNGGLHSINSIVQDKKILTFDRNDLKHDELSHSSFYPILKSGVNSTDLTLKAIGWWKGKGSGRPRKSQPGPRLLWKNKEKIVFDLQLEVMAVHGWLVLISILLFFFYMKTLQHSFLF